MKIQLLRFPIISCWRLGLWNGRGPTDRFQAKAGPGHDPGRSPVMRLGWWLRDGPLFLVSRTRRGSGVPLGRRPFYFAWGCFRNFGSRLSGAALDALSHRFLVGVPVYKREQSGRPSRA